MPRKKPAAEPRRCEWPRDAHPIEIEYHDTEWGVPSRDDVHLFEMLVLDGAQAGLSWSTILNKRAGYRRLFADFDAAKVARFTPKRIEKLLADPGIVRNRQKVESAVNNARRVLEVQEEFGSLAEFLWQFTDGRTIQNRWRRLADLPAETAESRAMSKELRRRGFGFCGPTICYAIMQTIGMVNDHMVMCYRHAELSK